jgi:molybdate transport system regulatory protein
VWFELEGKRAFCSGVCQILRAVETTGSIKDAAASIGRSYRFAWGKIKHVEQALGRSLVETRVGGSQQKRSVLTVAGQHLVVEFETLRQRVFQLIDDEFARSLQATIDRLDHDRLG